MLDFPPTANRQVDPTLRGNLYLTYLSSSRSRWAWRPWKSPRATVTSISLWKHTRAPTNTHTHIQCHLSATIELVNFACVCQQGHCLYRRINMHELHNTSVFTVCLSRWLTHKKYCNKSMCHQVEQRVTRIYCNSHVKRRTPYFSSLRHSVF